MPMNRTLAFDGTVALSLAFALGVVIIADRNRAGPPSSGVVIASKPPAEPAPLAPRLRLAVTPPQYDDMGKLLDQLGAGYSYTKIRLQDLEDASKLLDFNVIFLTCGTDPPSWVTGDLGEGDRPGVHRARYNVDVLDRVREALRTFVGRGGTLYVSDWRLGLIRYCFSELFEGQDIVEGARQTLTAEVVDPGLRDVLGKSVELKFDLPGWKPAALSGDNATIYLRGEYRPNVGDARVSAPLLVKVPFEQGTIIFTSFHNEKVNSELETKMLRFLVFAAVTAKETAEAQKTMVSGGFSPQKQNLLSASPETPSVTQTYANTKPGRLRFALSFANQGAQLRLTVRGPDNKIYEQEGTSTFNVDVPNAAAGNWSYTVTAQKVPYPNFPFTLTIGGE